MALAGAMWMRDGVLYHRLTKKLYEKHVKDGWKDRRIMSRYGLTKDELEEWKKKYIGKGAGKMTVAEKVGLTREAYIQHKKDEWTDKKIYEHYGMSNQGLVNWKKENFSPKEIQELSLLKKTAPKNLPKVPHNEDQTMNYEEKYRQAKKNTEVLERVIKDLKEQLDIAEDEKGRMRAEHEQALQELASEKELAYQEAREWHEKYKALQEEVDKLKKQAVQDDYRIQNLSFLLKKAEQQLAEVKQETEPLRQLLSIYLARREQDVS